MLLNEFALPLIEELNLAAKTKTNYRYSYRKYIASKIGTIEIDKVTKQDILESIALLPQQTKYQALMVLRTIFREAEERELIEINFAKLVKTPAIKVTPAKFLTWDELERIDFGKQTERIQFLALHGLRWSEAVALEDRDIYDGLVHINKSAWGKTKSIAGNRVVPAMAPYVSFPKSQSNIAKLLKPYGVTVHSLRKTYAYILKTSKVHVTTAAKMMGHSNPLVTLKIYTLVRDDEIFKSQVNMQRVVGANRFSGLNKAGLITEDFALTS
jgi:integrase